jgi:hypothetical protein
MRMRMRITSSDEVDEDTASAVEDLYTPQRMSFRTDLVSAVMPVEGLRKNVREVFHAQDAHDCIEVAKLLILRN